MNLKAYILPLIKYWWLIAAAAVVAMVSSYLVTQQQAPIYQTQTTMVVGRAMYEANPSSNDLWLGQQLASYYADIGQRGEVRNATQEALGLTRLPQYVINPLPNSQLMEIVVNDSNPARAQAVANELANQLIMRSPTSNQQQGSERQTFIDEQITYLEGKIRETLIEIEKADLQLTEMNSARQIADAQQEISALQTKLSQLQSNYAALISNTDQGAINTLSVIERAPLPTEPIGPNNTLIIAMAALVAVVIAASAAYLLEMLDDSVKSAEDVNEMLGSPVLANVPNILKGDDENTLKPVTPLQALGRRIIDIFPSRQKQGGDKEVGEKNEGVFVYTQRYPRSTIAEEFRSLRINLDFAGVDKPLRTILVTSPSPAEGKTSVASNLAIVMAQSGKKVVLLDADFRKPSIDTHFQISNKIGLSDIFRENVDPHEVTQLWKEKLLWIITTGKAPPNPVDLLSSHRMSQILEQLQSLADVVIIDGPPLMFPDSIALSTKVDGVLMVLRHSYTRQGTAKARYQQLTQVGAHIVGIVMNKTPNRRSKYYKSYNTYRSYNEGDIEPGTEQAK